MAPRDASRFAPALDPETCSGKWFLPTPEIAQKLQRFEDEMHSAWREVEHGESVTNDLFNKAIYLRQVLDHFLYDLNFQASKQKKSASFANPIQLWKIDDPHMLNALRNQAEGRPYSEGAVHEKDLETRLQEATAATTSPEIRPTNKREPQNSIGNANVHTSTPLLSTDGGRSDPDSSAGYTPDSESEQDRSHAPSPEPTGPEYEDSVMAGSASTPAPDQKFLVEQLFTPDPTQSDVETSRTLTPEIQLLEPKIEAIPDDEDSKTVEMMLLESKDIESQSNSGEISEEMGLPEYEFGSSGLGVSAAPEAIVLTRGMNHAQMWNLIIPE
ncbi:hypothetical protein FRC01_008320, partial [Tulasnella sp. 417]